MPTNRRFTLVRRPRGLPVAADFQLVEEPLPELSDGQVLVHNHYASLDPAIRGWLDDTPSYLPPVQLGDPVRANTVGVVVASRSPQLSVGQWVTGRSALEDYSLCQPGGPLRPVDPNATASVTHHLSILGVVGLTAYFAMLDVGRPKPGETVLVTGAAGAVGSLAGQLAKMAGCRTIGVAGGPAKCERLLQDYGYDAAIDYRGKSPQELARAMRDAAPTGVDLLFENVGGEILDAALMLLRPKARVVLCGLVSQYNSEPHPLRNLQQVLVNGASINGFILTHYAPRLAEALPQLTAWSNAGRLRMDEHVEVGLENALPAFLRLFDGSNTGKMILQLSS